MIKEQATRNLNNFLSSYTLEESNEMLNQVFDLFTNAMTADTNGRMEEVLDFLEALEELLPAVYTEKP